MDYKIHQKRTVFLKEFISLLTDIGNLWTTNTITPSHERFISTLIKQKILVNIERIQNTNSKEDKVFILFLILKPYHFLIGCKSTVELRDSYVFFCRIQGRKLCRIQGGKFSRIQGGKFRWT